MKTKLSVGDVVSSAQVLQVVANTKMPVKTSYRINKILRKVSREIDIYEEERKKIFEEFGEEEQQGMLRIPEKNMEEATTLLDELLSEEVEIELPEVTIDHLSSIELTPLEFQALEPLLTINEEPDDLP